MATVKTPREARGLRQMSTRPTTMYDAMARIAGARSCQHLRHAHLMRGQRDIAHIQETMWDKSVAQALRMSERGRFNSANREYNTLASIKSLLNEVNESRDQLQSSYAEIEVTNEQLQTTGEALKRANEDLEQFASVASHELREPLRTIARYAQQLAEQYKEKLDSGATDSLAYMSNQSEQLQVLIDNVLAYARVGMEEKLLKPVDCEAVFNQIMPNLQEAVNEAKAVVTHDTLPTVMGDEMQLGRVLQNLIHNAIKYHGAEPPRIHLLAKKEANKWQFSVQDNGIGMEPESIEDIFKMFVRLHPRSEYAGSGMGLSIVEKIVQQHGGRIWAESEPGEGSVFYFTLPAGEA